MADEDPTTTPPTPPAPPPPPTSKELENFYLPIYIITAFFGAIFIICPLLVCKSKNKGILRCCIMLTAFSLWLFYVTMYIAQMNPLVGPRITNRSAAWVGYKWGDPAK